MSIRLYNSATLNTANTNINGSGTLGTNIISLVTGSNPGTVVDEIQISAAGVIRMYAYNGGGVTTLLAEYPVTAVASPGVAAGSLTPTWKITIRPINMFLYTNQELRFTTNNSETFHVTVFCTIL
jgi:hypothetical protein